MKKKKIGFIINYRLNGWLGVTNYYKNFFKILQSVRKDKYEIVIITDNNFQKSEKKTFGNLKILKSNIFNRNSKFQKIRHLLSIIFFGKSAPLENFLKKNKINIISHTSYTGKNSSIPSLKWFPDFQELKYPENFSLKQKLARKIDIYLSTIHSSRIILSSKSVQNHLKKINYNSFRKSIIISHSTYLEENFKFSNFNKLKKKYKISNNFFYLPNHYWKHKNHIVVYKAINELKKKYKKIKLVTSGNSFDYRFPDHFKKLTKFIKRNKLEKNITYLGVIPLRDVFTLIKNCIAVINSSLFEGWGNSLEHAINLDKIALVSNIDVHKERQYKNKILFNPKNYKDLFKKMEKIINKKFYFKKDKNIKKNLEYKHFAETYFDLIEKLLKKY